MNKDNYTERGFIRLSDKVLIDINKVVQLAKTKTPQPLAISKIEYFRDVFKEAKQSLGPETEKRIKAADARYPIIVEKTPTKYLYLDGYHRTIQMIRDGVDEVMAVVLTSEEVATTLVASEDELTG